MNQVLHVLSAAVVVVVLWCAVGRPLVRRGWFEANQPDPPEPEVVPQRLRAASRAGAASESAARGAAAAWPQLPQLPPGVEHDLAAEARAICVDAAGGAS